MVKKDKALTVPSISIEASPSLDACVRLAGAYAAIVRRFDSTLGNVHGLSFGDFILLYQLGRAPGERLRRVDLAERLGLTASGVTRTLIPLEKIGLVARQSDDRDARVGYAVLTEAGRELLKHALVSADFLGQEITQSVTQKNMDALSSTLAQLAGMTNKI